MIQYITITISLLSIIFKFLLFSFVYHPLYKQCNIQQKIKKHGKTKIIHKPKIIIAFGYFALLFILFNLFTMKLILFTIFGILFGSLYVYEKFSTELDAQLEKYNKSPISIFCWKIFHSIFTLIYMCTNPINKIVYGYLQKKFLIAKKMISYITHLDSNSFGDKDLKEINKQLEELAEKKKEE